ncbi:hypothetical protein JVT61DRAFT_12866 [Boletus reticuloceps]|uniref:Uncharacterized protein n=1 Tax=Boletus reticuloceps TaxID=495285 RepID=A0A8I2YV34_9AGAM|nr:hypothetical protein JVT61DRAFT_12866 [Boletus reticuloceps]
MSTSTSLRKRPHCHKCGSPMQGHKRKNGTFVCPEETSTFSEIVSSTYKSHSTPLPSPPASPGGSPRTSSQGFLPAREKPVFKPPPGERWHWRNPNWVSPPRKTRLYTPSDWERGSLTPTEPVTEPIVSQRGTHLSPNVIREEEEEEEEEDVSASWQEDNDDQNREDFEYFPRHSNSLSPRLWSPFSQSLVNDITLDTALRASTPLFKVFRTPFEDLDGVRRIAQREGKHVAIIDAPPAHRAMARLPTDEANGTVWVVVSDRIEDLKYAINSQQMGMPGTFFPEGPQTRGIGFFQVAFAGILGGLMVAVGLAYL